MNDVGMLNGGHDLDLPADPQGVLLSLDLGFLDGLDRHLLVGRSVDGELYFTVGALSQLADNLKSLSQLVFLPGAILRIFLDNHGEESTAKIGSCQSKYSPVVPFIDSGGLACVTLVGRLLLPRTSPRVGGDPRLCFTAGLVAHWGARVDGWWNCGTHVETGGVGKKKENEDRYTLRCFWGGEDSTGRRSHHGHFGGTAWDDVPVRRGGVSTGNGRNAFSVRKGGNDVIAEKWC